MVSAVAPGALLNYGNNNRLLHEKETFSGHQSLDGKTRGSLTRPIFPSLRRVEKSHRSPTFHDVMRRGFPCKSPPREVDLLKKPQGIHRDTRGTDDARGQVNCA